MRANFTFPLNTTRIQQCKISDFLKVVHSWSGTLNTAVASCIVSGVTGTRAEVAELRCCFIPLTGTGTAHTGSKRVRPEAGKRHFPKAEKKEPLLHT